MKYISLIVSVALLVYLPGCEDLPCNKSVDQSRIDAVDQAQLQADITAIDAYLTAQGITAVKDITGVRYVVKTQGFGGTPCLENQVAVIYKGRLLANGKEFDSGIAEFKLNELILGWQIVLPQYPKDTKLTIYVPSVFGYGSGGTATSTIPANSNLIFDIELTNIR